MEPFQQIHVFLEICVFPCYFDAALYIPNIARILTLGMRDELQGVMNRVQKKLNVKSVHAYFSGQVIHSLDS